MALTPITRQKFTGSAPQAGGLPAPHFGSASQALGRIGEALGKVENNIVKSMEEQAIAEGKEEGLKAGQEKVLQKREGRTLRDQAFNSVALQTFKGKQELVNRKQMGEAFVANSHSPAAYEKAVAEIRKTSLKGIPDELVPDFNNMIDKQLIVGLEASGREHTKTVNSANKAVAADVVTERLRGLERNAFALSGNDRANNMVLDDMESLRKTLVQYGPRGSFEFMGEKFEPDIGRSGVFTPLDMQGFMQAAEDGAIVNKALGQFDRAPGVSAKIAVRNGLRPAWESGELDISEGQLTSLENRMDGDIRSAKVENSAGLRALTNKVKQINGLVEKGFDIKPEDWNGIQAEVAANGDPLLAETLNAAKSLSQFQSSIKQLAPADLQLVVSEQRNQIEEAGGIEDFEQVRRLDVSEKLLTEMKTELRRDPISWGVRVGLIDNSPLVLEGDLAADSMDRRRAQADALARHYGITPRFMTDEEVSQLSEGLPGMTVDQKLALSNTIALGFGDDAAAVLNRVSDNNATFSHVGGLMLGGSQGNADVARNIFSGNIARIDDKNNILPSKIDLDTGYANLAGGALGASSKTRANVINAAKDIYTRKGLLAGLTSDEFDEDLWDQSLNEAAGAVFVDGAQYGGFGDYNGEKIVLPKGMTQDDFDQRLGSINDDKITTGVFGDVPRHVDGTIATADEIEDGVLISVGDGLYAIALNEDGTDLLVGSDPTRAFHFDAKRINVEFEPQSSLTGTVDLSLLGRFDDGKK